MKKLLLWLGILGLPGVSFAGPYFQLVNINHLTPVVGALIDVYDTNNSEGTGLEPLITHSPNDGCFLPSIVCEDWSPLAVGFSAIAGSYSFAVAPLFNVLPALQGVALLVTPEKLSGLRSVLNPYHSSVTFSAGPAWEYKSATNKGYFRVFTGLALHF